MKNLQENILRISGLMYLKEDDSTDVQINRAETGSDQQIKQTGPTDNDNAVDGMDEEIVEQEDGDDSTDTTTDTSSDTGASITPWESGVQRGPGNPITSAKKEDKVTRGKGNQLGATKWTSDRTYGPTGKNYK